MGIIIAALDAAEVQTFERSNLVLVEQVNVELKRFDPFCRVKFGLFVSIEEDSATTPEMNEEVVNVIVPVCETGLTTAPKS